MALSKNIKKEIKDHNKQYVNTEWSANIVELDGKKYLSNIQSYREMESFSSSSNVILKNVYGFIHSHPSHINQRLDFSTRDIWLALQAAYNRYHSIREPWYEFVVSARTGTIKGMKINGAKVNYHIISELRSLRSKDQRKIDSIVRNLKATGVIEIIKV